MNPTFEEFVAALKRSQFEGTYEDFDTINAFARRVGSDLAKLDDGVPIEECERVSREAVEIIERFMRENPEYKFLVAVAFMGMLLQISQ